jgi:hypothetical protein
MLIAGLVAFGFLALLMYLLISNISALPKFLLKYLGYFLLFISALELLLLIWVLIFIGLSDWTLWGLSFNDFWKEQLSAIYPIKLWLYSWLWNDLLDFFWELLPAIVFLTFRTSITTILGILSLTESKKH